MLSSLQIKTKILSQYKTCAHKKPNFCLLLPELVLASPLAILLVPTRPFGNCYLGPNRLFYETAQTELKRGYIKGKRTENTEQFSTFDEIPYYKKEPNFRAPSVPGPSDPLTCLQLTPRTSSSYHPPWYPHPPSIPLFSPSCISANHLCLNC